MFGARALHGRVFKSLEDQPQGPHVVVLGHGFWLRRFAGNPSRRRTHAAARRHVLRDRRRAQRTISVPTRRSTSTCRSGPNEFSLDFANVIRVVGRLAGNRTVGHARPAALEHLAGFFREKFPLSMGPWEDFWAVPLRDAMVGDVKPALRMLSGAVVFVLLIGCANVATLLLARGQRRRREIATRAALGAQRWRVVRQLLTESGLLAVGGGVLGLAAGVAGLRAIVRAGADAIPEPGARQARPSRSIPTSCGSPSAVSLATGVLFGVLPALTTSRVDLSSAFKDAGTSAEGGWRRHRTQSALVVLEMTLAIVLLVGCGLMVRTLMALRDVDRGFDPRRVMALDTSLSGTSLQQTDAVAACRPQRAAAPRERSLASSRSRPRARCRSNQRSRCRSRSTGVRSERAVRRQRRLARASRRSTSTSSGSRCCAAARSTSTTIATASRSSSSTLRWCAATGRRNDPVGERITIGTGAGPEFREGPRRIVGVVADPRDEEANRNPEPTVYVPLAQVSDAMTARNNRLFPLTWTVRTEIEPRLLRAPIERELRAATGGLPVARTRTMEEVLAGPARRAAFHVTLMTAFAAVALLLAIVGFYGLMLYSVQQRTQEIGIRMALGAVPADVRNMVLLQGLARRRRGRLRDRRRAGADAGHGVAGLRREDLRSRRLRRVASS